MRPGSLPDLTTATRTLVLALAGGLLFSALQLPIPWLLGPLLACLGATLAGRSVAVPRPLGFPTALLIGAYLGGRLSPQLLADALQWLPSLALMLGLMALSMALVSGFYRRVGGFDPATAFFAAIPGGLSAVLLFGAAAGARLPLVTLAQCLRMALIVVSMPFLVQGLYGGQATLPPQTAADLIPLDQLGLLLLVCLGVIGLLRRLALPSPEIACALFVSATLYGSGLVAGQLPNALLNGALCLLGASVGARFDALDRTLLLRGGLQAVAATLLAVGLAAAVAVPASWISGVPFMAAWLAFMPGGIGEICLVAILFHIEPAYVVTHQVLRLFVLMALMSFWGWRTPNPGGRRGADASGGE